MTFYGHTDIATEVAAICKVQGGPTYQLILAGEASDIEYRLDKKKLYVETVVCIISQVILCMTAFLNHRLMIVCVQTKLF